MRLLWGFLVRLPLEVHSYKLNQFKILYKSLGVFSTHTHTDKHTHTHTHTHKHTEKIYSASCMKFLDLIEYGFLTA